MSKAPDCGAARLHPGYKRCRSRFVNEVICMKGTISANLSENPAMVFLLADSLLLLVTVG